MLRGTAPIRGPPLIIILIIIIVIIIIFRLHYAIVCFQIKHTNDDIHILNIRSLINQILNH